MISDVVELYNEGHDKWDKANSMPIALRLFSTAVVGTVFYSLEIFSLETPKKMVKDVNVFVFGGYSIEKQSAFSDTWKLDMTTGKWSAGQKLLSQRHGHRTIQYGFDLLHVGGFGQMPFEKWV